MVVKRLVTSHVETSQELLLLDKKMSIPLTATHRAKKVGENTFKSLSVAFASLLSTSPPPSLFSRFRFQT